MSEMKREMVRKIACELRFCGKLSYPEVTVNKEIIGMMVQLRTSFFFFKHENRQEKER